MSSPTTEPLRVVVLGGGVAAAEAVLALRAQAGPDVAIELIAAEPTFAVRAAATAAPFGGAPVDAISLADLARDAGATLVVDRAEAVSPAVRRVRLASGAHRDYDALVLALGARARAAIPGATTFRDQRDLPQLERVLDDLRTTDAERVAIAVPAGVAWTLPAYELALFAAAEVERLGLRTRVSLVTPERTPLEVFGGAASTAVAGALAERGVDLATSTAPRLADRHGVRLVHGGTIAADRVVAVPALIGRRLSGIPAGFGGFVTTRAFGRVDGLPDVFAAGDMTSFPVKQGGLAAQQADAIATVIALRAGASPPMPPLTSVLRTQLFGAPRPLFLEATLDAGGRPVPGTSAVHDECPWWPHGTLFGRRLSPWLAQRSLALAA